MANENLQKYALVAEIVSAAAVVVSLIFVAFQVSDNTAAIRSSTYDGILSDHIEWRMSVATSPYLADAMIRVDSEDTAVTEGERANVERARQGLWQIYERAYFARQYGTLGDSEWARYERAICRIAPLFDVETVLGRYLTSEFVDFAKSCDLGECVEFYGEDCSLNP